MNINTHGFPANRVTELNDLGITRTLGMESHAFNELFNTSKLITGCGINLLLGIYKFIA